MNFYINKSIVDVRSQPIERQEIYFDPYQSTQLLYGDKIKILAKKSLWVFVECENQYLFERDWKKYRGWIKTNTYLEKDNYYYNGIVIQPFKKDDTFFSFGSKLKVIKIEPEYVIVRLLNDETIKIKRDFIQLNSDNKLCREEIAKRAKQFLGFPYLWGGRSSYSSDLPSSVDCSGLIQLLYHSFGIKMARNAHDQFLATVPIEYEQLQKGDLIFTAPLNKRRMDHVMLFLENDFLLESTANPGVVRTVSGKEKLGTPLPLIKNGQIIGQKKVFFTKCPHFLSL